MTPQQVVPILIPILVVGLIVLKSHGAPRTLRPQFMWVMPAVVLPLIGMGLFFTPHQPFGPVAWLAFAAARALGAAFGWWNFVTKANLALAAGLALPLLAVFGYSPGSREADAVAALATVYALVPLALKLAAMALLWVWRRRLEPSPSLDDAATAAQPGA